MYRIMNTNITPSQDMGQQPLPMQALPLITQQPIIQQPIIQPPMQSAPMSPMTATPSITPSPPAGGTPIAQFRNYEELALLSQGMTVTAESIQFLNGFLRTQIGKRVKVDFLIGSNTYQDRTGILLGVGINYILINETNTDDLTACDFYNIKFITFYH